MRKGDINMTLTFHDILCNSVEMGNKPGHSCFPKNTVPPMNTVPAVLTCILQGSMSDSPSKLALRKWAARLDAMSSKVNFPDLSQFYIHCFTM